MIIIVFIVSVFEGEWVEIFSVGCDDFLSKFFCFEELIVFLVKYLAVVLFF